MKERAYSPPHIPDHEVLRKIGGGSYGDVWMGRSVTGMMRAIKVIWRADFDNNADFEREFEGIKNYEPISRKHEGLIPILHVGRSSGLQDQEFYYYIMELADDIHSEQSFNPVEYIPRTLRSDLLAADGKPIDIDHCIEVGKQTALALSSLHSQGLAHRDIKPSNIVYQAGKPKLADVGLVAVPGRHTFVGTQGFIPPEGAGTRRADIYALGKVLYEMTTGRDRMDFPQLPECPFKGEKAKRWRALNSVICDLCDPREEHRGIKTAVPLSATLDKIGAGSDYKRKKVLPKLLKPVLAIAALIATIFFFANLGTDKAENISVPVKITSKPIGAEVWTSDGDFLGTTPLAGRELEVGSHHQYEFRLRGFATIREDCYVKSPGVILEAILPIFAPPEQDLRWSDSTGMIYIPEKRGHITWFPTLRWATDKFLRQNKDIKTTFEYGIIKDKNISRGVTLTNLESAQLYCKWLTKRSIAEGYLTNEFQITAVIDHDSKVTNRSAKAKKLKLTPFKCLVTRIPFAELRVIAPEDVDITLFIDGKKQELLSYENRLVVQKVKPGIRTITIEPEGYKPYAKKLEFKDSATLEHSLELKANNSVVFDREWENSLGMMLKPVTPSLMVAAHETTLAQFKEYCESSEKKLPSSPHFTQDDNHPIVNVSRSDAEAFCAWLTKKERKERRIGRSFTYRLPTDQEWSFFSGLDTEEGNTPFERDVGDNETFSWGKEWPPKEQSGNFANSEGPNPEKLRVVEDYSDNYAYTAPVGQFSQNSYGLYDISGNVYEWVSDDFGVGSYGVTRGASWLSYQKETLYLKFRNVISPKILNNETGFRVVLSKSE